MGTVSTGLGTRLGCIARQAHGYCVDGSGNETRLYCKAMGTVSTGLPTRLYRNKHMGTVSTGLGTRLGCIARQAHGYCVDRSGNETRLYCNKHMGTVSTVPDRGM